MVAEVSSPVIHIDDDRCLRCDACVRECPAAPFHNLTAVTAVAAGQCLQCGHCLAVCPTGALRHAAFPTAVDWGELPAQVATDDALRLLASRRSVRAYARIPVGDARWHALLTAMGAAPSGMNARSVRATIVTSPEVLAALSAQTVAFYAPLVRLVQSVAGRVTLRLMAGRTALRRLQANANELEAIIESAAAGNDPVLHGAPGALVLHAAVDSPCGHDDCLLAAMAAMLHAPTLGLGTCLIGFMLPALQRQPAMRRLLEVPTGHEVYAVLAVGVPAVPYRRTIPREPVPARWL